MKEIIKLNAKLLNGRRYLQMTSNKGSVYPKYIKTDKNPKRQIIQFKNGQNIWTDIFPKETFSWPTNTWEDTYDHLPLGKYKSNIQ